MCDKHRPKTSRRKFFEPKRIRMNLPKRCIPLNLLKLISEDCQSVIWHLNYHEFRKAWGKATEDKNPPPCKKGE